MTPAMQDLRNSLETQKRRRSYNPPPRLTQILERAMVPTMAMVPERAIILMAMVTFLEKVIILMRQPPAHLS